MSENTTVREHVFSNGVNTMIRDVTRHYYGGYFHVRLEVSAEVPVIEDYFDCCEMFRDALLRLGATARYCRLLERMAVPVHEVDSARTALLETFEASVVPYVSRDDFPSRLVRSEYTKILKLGVPTGR